jgi:hypothetical protein
MTHPSNIMSGGRTLVLASISFVVLTWVLFLGFPIVARLGFAALGISDNPGWGVVLYIVLGFAHLLAFLGSVIGCSILLFGLFHVPGSRDLKNLGVVVLGLSLCGFIGWGIFFYLGKI